MNPARSVVPCPTPPSLHRAPEALAPFVRRHLPGVEAALAAALPCPAGLPPILDAATREALGVEGHPGSRWRPLLTLAAAEATGGDPVAVLPVAVAVELTHTASLVLDDLPSMDDADQRRGRSSTHRQVGSGGAILLAVSLLARSAELLGALPSRGGRLSAEWGEAFGLSGMAGGQAVDLTGAFSGGGAARRLHRRKTTALSAFAVRAGAVAAGAPEPVVLGLSRFGRDLGWAYQLADDAEDWKEDARLGRGPGGRSPRRQSLRLLEGTLRRMRDLPGLSAQGVLLMEALARQTAGFPQNPGGRKWA
jgi:geranylgeranyl diphosphate synthase, type II